MKKKVFLFPFISIFFCSVALCQDKTLLSENFTNNKKGWRLQKDSSFSVDINNGILRLEKFRKNYDDRGCLWYTKEINGLNTLEDFSITIYAKFISGGDILDMLDIQWGVWNKVIASTNTNIYQLNFLLKGDVKLDYFNKQWNYSFRTKAKEILDRNLYRANEYNKYELVQKDGFVIFRINDKQYFKQFATPIAGNTIGFQGCLKSVWEIDKIIVKQAKTKAKESAVQSITTDTAIIAGSIIEGSLKVYPNPFINEFIVPVSAEKSTTAKIELFDIKGNLIIQYDRKLDEGEHRVRLFADVPAGIYLVKLTMDNKTTTAKLVKL